MRSRHVLNIQCFCSTARTPFLSCCTIYCLFYLLIYLLVNQKRDTEQYTMQHEQDNKARKIQTLTVALLYNFSKHICNIFTRPECCGSVIKTRNLRSHTTCSATPAAAHRLCQGRGQGKTWGLSPQAANLAPPPNTTDLAKMNLSLMSNFAPPPELQMLQSF